jgi:hypothetical protein
MHGFARGSIWLLDDLDEIGFAVELPSLRCDRWLCLREIVIENRFPMRQSPVGYASQHLRPAD